MTFTDLRWISLGLMLALVSGVWLMSLWRRDASLIDLFWGALFALQAGVHGLGSPGAGLRAGVVGALVAIWALRLGLHLACRNLPHGEDPRYAAMREAGGPGWAVRSLVTVFWLQAALAWGIGWPVAVVASSSGVPGAVGWTGLGVAILGLVFEAVADLQLTRFRADPGNRGRVLDRGLWRWSRHPNYFGDAVMWWGLWLVAVEVGAAWTVFAPIAMTLLLLRISGVPLLERRLTETRPGYREYVERTSAFIPWFPKEGGP